MQRIGRIIGVSDDLILEVWPGVRSLLRLRSRGLEQDGEVPPGNSIGGSALADGPGRGRQDARGGKPGAG